MKTLFLVGILSTALAAAQQTSIPLGVLTAYDNAGRMGASVGSVSLIAKSRTKAYWISAYHVTRGQRGPIAIKRPGKPDLAGTIIASKRDPDLVLVRTSVHTVTKNPFPVWTKPLRSGIYYAEGYSGQYGFGRRKGRLISANSAQARWGFPSIPGESGGCCYFLHGNTKYLTGVVSASDWVGNERGLRPGFTIGGHNTAIINFLGSAGLQVGADGYARVATGYYETGCGLFRNVFGGRHHPDPCPQCQPGGNPQYQGPNVIPEDYTPPQNVVPSQPDVGVTPVDPGAGNGGALTPETPVMQADELEEFIRKIVREEMPEPIPGPPGRDGVDGAQGAQGAQGLPGRDGPAMDEILATIKPLLVNGIQNQVAAEIDSRQLVDSMTLHQTVQRAVQAALDEIAANPKALADSITPYLDGEALAKKTQKHLDPIGLEFQDPLGNIIQGKDGPMSYEQKLGGKFIFKYKPSQLAYPAGAK